MLLIDAASFTLVYMSRIGTVSILVIFAKYVYAWNDTQAGLSTALLYGSNGVVLVLLFPLMTRILGHGIRKETILVELSVLFSCAGYTLAGFASQSWMMYAAISILALSAINMPVFRSRLSCGVRPDQQGLVFTSLTAIESITLLIAPIIFNNVYSATVYEWPGAVFFVMAGVCAPVAGLGLYGLCPVPKNRGRRFSRAYLNGDGAVSGSIARRTSVTPASAAAAAAAAGAGDAEEDGYASYVENDDAAVSQPLIN